MDDEDRHLIGLDMSKLLPEARPVLIALGQLQNGEPVTQHCLQCGELIAVEAHTLPRRRGHLHGLFRALAAGATPQCVGSSRFQKCSPAGASSQRIYRGFATANLLLQLGVANFLSVPASMYGRVRCRVPAGALLREKYPSECPQSVWLMLDTIARCWTTSEMPKP